MDIEQTFPAVKGECNVFIEVSKADVVVNGWDKAELGVSAPADQVNVRQEGGDFKIRLVGHENDFAVYVPQDCDLRLQSSIGDVEIKDVVGAVWVNCKHGDVQVDKLSGALAIQTAAGDVDVADCKLEELKVETFTGDVAIKNVEGPVKIDSKSGDVHVEDLRGALVIQEASGDVMVSDLSGDLTAKSISGDITVRAHTLNSLNLESVSGDTLIEAVLNAEGRYRVRSVSGDLTLRIPEDQPCTLAHHSFSGDLRVALPHAKQHAGLVDVNGGGVVFDMTNISGDVKVEAAGATSESEDECDEDEDEGTEEAECDEGEDAEEGECDEDKDSKEPFSIPSIDAAVTHGMEGLGERLEKLGVGRHDSWERHAERRREEMERRLERQREDMERQREDMERRRERMEEQFARRREDMERLGERLQKLGVTQQEEQPEEQVATGPSLTAQRMGILKAIEAGEISVDEGLAKLREIK